MKVKILRGVCVGIDDDAKPGDIRDLDPLTADYLKNIGAAEDAPPEPAVVAEEAPAAGAGSESQEAAAAAGETKEPSA